MRDRIKAHLTYANVMVTILAFIVLGGVAVAGTAALKKNSVGTKQLKNGAVTKAKIKKGAVDSSRLSSSALNGYAKSSDLSGFLKAPVGPDQLGTMPAASLRGPIYNVGGAGGAVDCQGTSTNKFPDNKVDDIDFSTVGFDTAGLAHTEPQAVSACYNGFAVSRAGIYLVSAWVGWENAPAGVREIALKAMRPGEACCDTLAVDIRAAVIGAATSQTASVVTRLGAGTTVYLLGKQDSGAELLFAGGGMQIAWLGN